MRTSHTFYTSKVPATQRGVTLIELIVFIVIISVALVALLGVFSFQVTNSVDPVARVKALEKGQAVLDEILSRKFDDNTPTGGVPACDSANGVACAGIDPDGVYDDVGDYKVFSSADFPDHDPRYPVSVEVSPVAENELPGIGEGDGEARLITVTVGMPNGGTLKLSAYRMNF